MPQFGETSLSLAEQARIDAILERLDRNQELLISEEDEDPDRNGSSSA